MRVSVLGFGELSDGGWTNPQWMAKTLGEFNYDVTYFNPPAYRPLKLSDVKRLRYRFIGGSSKLAFATVNLYYPFRFLGKLINFRLYSSVSNSDVVIIFHPNWLKCLDLKWIVNCKVIYFKTDDYASVAKNPDAIKRLEQKLSHSASSVCVTSRNLFRGMPNEAYFPNCIPTYLLDTKFQSTTDLDIQGDVINACYVGAIWDDKVDVQMLIQGIQSAESTHFHFAGKIFSQAFKDFITSDFSENVTYHGVLPFDLGFDLMLQCDLGLMPFLVNQYTDSMFSMKFFEYISAELPVLTTSIKMLEDLDDFSDCFHVSDHINMDEIQETILLSGNIDTAKFFLSAYTYEHRIRKMIDLEII